MADVVIPSTDRDLDAMLDAAERAASKATKAPKTQRVASEKRLHASTVRAANTNPENNATRRDVTPLLKSECRTIGELLRDQNALLWLRAHCAHALFMHAHGKIRADEMIRIIRYTIRTHGAEDSSVPSVGRSERVAQIGALRAQGDTSVGYKPTDIPVPIPRLAKTQADAARQKDAAEREAEKRTIEFARKARNRARFNSVPEVWVSRPTK